MKITSFSLPTSPMNSIEFPTVITTIYVLVDDWYKERIQPVIIKKPGVKPLMSVTIPKSYQPLEA